MYLKKSVVVEYLLTESLRVGARQLLTAAVEAEEVSEFRASHNAAEGEARFVRNGFLPELEIQTGIDNIKVKVPRVRDRVRLPDGLGFSSHLIPKYLRRSKNLNDFLPLLYLKGISTNGFAEVLKTLVGEAAGNLPPSAICRLKSAWETEYADWQKRSLAKGHYVHLWADGIHLKARMEGSSECVLVMIGVTEQGKKEGSLSMPIMFSFNTLSLDNSRFFFLSSFVSGFFRFRFGCYKTYGVVL